MHKWSMHKPGSVTWINNNDTHPLRKIFASYVIKNNLSSVIEIGPGELVEYSMIKKDNPDIKYTIVDLSISFMHFCKENYPEVSRIYAIADEPNVLWDEIKEKHDIVYCCSVLEHLYDVRNFVENMKKSANEFYFAMFKWSEQGGISPHLVEGKRYYSTCRNINMLLELISEYGNIEETFIVQKRDGEKIDFDEYRQYKKYFAGKKKCHRTGDYLVIKGKFNK